MNPQEHYYDDELKAMTNVLSYEAAIFALLTPKQGLKIPENYEYRLKSDNIIVIPEQEEGSTMDYLLLPERVEV